MLVGAHFARYTSKTQTQHKGRHALNVLINTIVTTKK